MEICLKLHFCQIRFKILPNTKFTLKILPNNIQHFASIPYAVQQSLDSDADTHLREVYGGTQGRIRQKSFLRRYQILFVEGHFHCARFSGTCVARFEAEVDLQIDGLGWRCWSQGARGIEQNMLGHVWRRKKRSQKNAQQWKEERNRWDHFDASLRCSGRPPEILSTLKFPLVFEGKETEKWAYARVPWRAHVDVSSRETKLPHP